ncbi:hypothetical protein ABIB51_002479, partial [Arthrobacter sp. UYCu712]
LGNPGPRYQLRDADIADATLGEQLIGSGHDPLPRPHRTWWRRGSRIP